MIRTLAALPLLLVLTSAPAAAGTPSPADWRDQSIYQIMTDRFRDGDPSNNAVEGFFDPADGARNHGGDWAGIEEKLDYIQGLGATAIWISPVQTNAFAAYHGYHIRDFYSFSAHFGGLAALQSLINAAHARGMFVILDVISNHGGDLIDSGDPGYPAFQNPGTYMLRWRDSANTAAPPFDDPAKYHNNGDIGNFTDPEQILGELFGLDDLRTEDPVVRQDLIDAHQWLIRQTDADGFRIDTVKHVELDFWPAFNPAVRSFAADSLGKANFFQFGEIFDGDPVKNGVYTGTMAGSAFALDSVLWYPMYFTALSVFRDGQPTQWLSNVLADSVNYDPAARNRLVTFLDNHDNGRFQGFGSTAQRDDGKARAALTWSHTSLGIPLVYYGTEQEFDGGSDPWNREDMWDGQWDFGPSLGDNFDMTTPLYRLLRRLNDLRGQFPALRRGSQEILAESGSGAGLYAYTRKLAGEETVLVAVNTATTSRTLTVDPDLPAGTVWDGLTGRSFDVPATGTVDIRVGGLSVAVVTAVQPVPPPPWVLSTWPVHDGELAALDAEIRIAFTQPMNTSSVAAALSIAPAVAHTARWQGATLIIRPNSALANATTYEVTVAGSAQSAAGASLGSDFSFFFRTSTAARAVTVPAGWTAYDLAPDDLVTPLSLEGGSGPFADRRVFLGDQGWGRILFWGDRGFIEARFTDSLVTFPTSLSQDTFGAFGGDLLATDQTALLRCRFDGLSGGSVEQLTTLPASAPDWIVAVDPGGAFQGDAFLAHSGSGAVVRSDSTGAFTLFAGGLGSVRGLAFGLGSGFGTDLHVLDGTGTIWRIDPAGQATVFASDAALAGAGSLAFDPVGSFGGSLYAAGSGTIVQIDAAGQVTTFATGVGAFPGNDCLAFDSLGDLHALADVGGTTTVVKVVPSSTAVALAVPPVRPPPAFAVSPSPFAGSTRIDFVVPPGTGDVRLAIHDVAGREVIVLEEGTFPEGARSVSWTGRDAAGRRLASGVYFARLRTGEREITRKVVLLH